MNPSVVRTPVHAPSNAAYAAARTLSDGQAKPLGALGTLEHLAAWVASCQGTCPPRQLDDVRVVVFAGDHGIAADGVSAYPTAITPAMVYGIAGGHAGVSALAAANDVRVGLYDLGVAIDFPDLPTEVSRFKVRRSSGAIHLVDALTRAEVEQALAAGDRPTAARLIHTLKGVAGTLGITSVHRKAAELDQALKDLAATELFKDFQITDNNGALTIEVTENPVINRVILEGNKRLKEDKIRPEIKLAPRQIFTRSKVRADVARIIALRPDLVLLNDEESRREDAEALATAGIPLWVTGPRSVLEAVGLLWQIMDVFDHPLMIPRVREIERAYDYTLAAARASAPVPVFVPIWRDPWMTFSADTYAGDMLRVCGGANVFAAGAGGRA